MLATPENAKTFFNGRDLTGWEGDPKLWTVEDGEIVGKTTGLARNEFLRSDLAAADFRLTVQVKLVKNEGNSGIQFRSEALPDGEMKGDQADVGAGWWGKLYEENGRGLLWDESGEAARQARRVEHLRDRRPSARRSRPRSTASPASTSTTPPGPGAGSSPSSSTRAGRPRSGSRTCGWSC